MSWLASRRTFRSAGPERLRRVGVLILAIALVILVSLVPASAERRNGAGLVVRHGDGTLIYVYVQFDGDSISGEDALENSGLDLTLAPFGGLGTGVCSIGGEGCPSDNCYCKSFSNPAYYWHYYSLVDGAWIEQLQGPTSRTMSDGDVDGWSWTAGDSGLPPTSIDEIAQINGVDRNAAEATATETLTATPTETLTETPTEALPTPTAAPTDTVTPTATTPAAVDTTPSSNPTTPTTTATEQAVATPASPRSTPTPTATTTSPVAAEKPTVLPIPATTTPEATTLAVAVNPSGTSTVVTPVSSSGGSHVAGYLLFGAMTLAALAVVAFLALRNRGARE